MKLWRWKAEAGNYAWGKFDYFLTKKAALKWLSKNDNFDILSLTDRWRNKTTYLKDRLYGRAGTPKADIMISMQTGLVTINYKDNENGEDRD